MRILCYLVLLLTFGIASAQTATILQGDYISNVFGNSNFVLNPNAQTSNCTTTGTITCANVTVSSASITRSTTTPLVARTEFLMTTSTATGFATWSTRTFDGGMKNQNCEARFSYRGFSVGSTTAQIVQGSNVVAQLTLTPSATDPRIASINFPCGDLSAATTFRLQQATAALTGTNEIGGIYVGLATNMANVAQAELVGSITFGTDCLWLTTSSTYNSPSDATCTPTVTGNVSSVAGIKPGIVINDTRPGNYQVLFQGGSYTKSSSAAYQFCSVRLDDGRNQNIGGYTDTPQNLNVNQILYMGSMFSYTTSGTKQINLLMASSDNATACLINTSVNGIQMSVYRFPSSSELVVTPERQNTWAGVTYSRTADSIAIGTGAAAPTGYSIYSDSVWNTGKVTYGKCQTTDVDANRIGCKIPSMPVGAYKMTVTGLLYEVATATGNVICSYALYESTTNNFFSSTTNFYSKTDGGVVYNGRTITGIFNNTAVGDRNFLIAANKTFDTTAGASGNCQAFVSNSGGDITNFNILIEPLDQPSNSALYVEGPVKASATGAAIPAGYAGYTVESTQTGTTTPTLSNTWYTSEAVTLTPGVWSCYADAGIFHQSPVPVGFTFFQAGICTGVGCIPPSTFAIHGSNAIGTPNGADFGAVVNNSRIINVTSSATYYLTIALTFTTRNTLVIDNNSSRLRCTLLN